MTLEKVFRYIDDNRDEYLRHCQELLRQPSVSGERENVYRCSEIVRDLINETGAKTDLIPVVGEGNPIIYGTLLNSNAHHTIVAYQMYDTQPFGELDKWSSPPNKAEVVDGRIIARGAINSKGVLVAELMAIKALLETMGEVPVNVVFTFDGEEEVGSWQLRKFLKEQPEKMRGAEAEWCPSTFSIDYKDTRITLGGKGCIDIQLVVDHSRGPIHSSCAPVVENPAWRLVWALESMRGNDGRIAIDGFYDDIKGPELGDQELLKKLAAAGEEEKMKNQWSVQSFIRDLHDVDLIQAYMFEPTLTINGLQSGYVGPAAYTINPGLAKANVDIRLVPGMDADDIWNKIKNHLQKHGFGDIEVRLNGWKANAYRSPSDTRIVMAHRKAIEAMGFNPPLTYPMSGGTGPSMYYTAPPLKMVSASSGSEGMPPHNAHAPNEWIGVEEFITTIKMCATFLWKYGSL
jgi:acetylornithine deacetylase/succinyl-diaminopimelate desuccinylase-like protein